MRRYVENRATLENWILLGAGSAYFLMGDVKGHPELGTPKDDPIRTSNIEWIDFASMEAQTRNTLYKLGRPAGGTRVLTDTMKVVL